MTTLFAAMSAVLGAIVGSFLNACIHRMPRGIGLANPKRSFCPSCQRLIPWYENLPVVSWIALRGKCSGCGCRISPRYLFVEVFVAGLFFFAWQKFGWPLAPVYWIFLSLLVVATFIDIEHFIIPDEITWGGTAAGILLSPVVPALMGVDTWWLALGLSAAGAALGFGLLWLVVELGKVAFGRKAVHFDGAQDFEWIRDGDRADLRIGDDVLRWEDVFSRESDVLRCSGVSDLVFDGQPVEAAEARFWFNRIEAGSQTVELDSLACITGKLRCVTIPREAMGFGDVKFIACIGAFLGWQAVLFTLLVSSVIGMFAALGGVFLSRDKSGARLPFGPFLALAAGIWVFAGPALVGWYFSFFGASWLR